MLFRSEEGVEAWRKRRGVPRGAVLTLEQTWQLSQRWYADRLSLRFRGRSATEAQQIFQELGLTGPFWNSIPEAH